MKRLLPYFLVLIFCACKPNTEIRSAAENYDINGLIDRQLELLDSVNPVLFKKAIISGLSETTELIPNDSMWQKELSIFRNADINKARLSDRFKTEKQSEAGLDIITYHSKSPESTKIDVLRIFLQNQTGDLLKIEAKIDHGNFLYESAESLDMRFGKINDICLVSDYRITGRQKMIFGSATEFTVEGKVLTRH